MWWRKGSPLMIGVGNGEYVVASDASAIVAHTNQAIELDDDTIARLTTDHSAHPIWRM